MYVASARPAAGADTGTTRAPRPRSVSTTVSSRPSTPVWLREPHSSSSTPTRRPRTSRSSTARASPGRAPSTESSSAVSGTVRASGPTRSSPGANGTTPRSGTTPGVGAIPTTPHCAAGSRTEPPVSVPTDCTASWAATAAAQPPLLPPALRRTSWGLWVRPCAEVWVEAPIASSSMFARPSSPASGPTASPAARRVSSAAACARTSSAATWTSARVRPSTSATRSRCARATSTAETSPARTIAASRTADRPVSGSPAGAGTTYGPAGVARTGDVMRRH